jgi:hypothetical protein
MQARGLLGALACAVALLTGLPTVGSAKPNYVATPKSLHLSASLPASNGYTASLSTTGHRQVLVSFFQGSYMIRYTAQGRVTRKGISADFGHLGSISLHFRSQRRTGGSRPFSLLHDCKGRKPVEERGVFVGSVRFRGERGFTRIRVHRVKGRVQRTYRRVCKGPALLRASASSDEEYDGNLLNAVAHANGTTRTFLALENKLELGGEPFDLAVEAAILGRKVEGVAISKTVFTLDEGAFHLGPRGEGPVEVKVVPSWPFLGSATYLARGMEAATWSGSLGARFPGSGQVSLAGPEFDSELCRAASPSRFQRCAETIQSLRLLQGSGSHSQPLALARLSSLR